MTKLNNFEIALFFFFFWGGRVFEVFVFKFFFLFVFIELVKLSVFPFVYMFHCFLTRLKKILHPSLSPEDRRRSFGGVFCPYSRIVAFFIMFQYFSRITFSLSSQKFLHMLLVLLWNSPCQNKTIALPL